MAEPAPLLDPVRPRQSATRLWRGGSFVADDWHAVEDGAVLPTTGPIIVSLARWRAEQMQFATRAAPVGVRSAAGEVIAVVSDNLERLALIALPFPKFSDGRSYSAARRLREAGFAGEIRAVGDVLLDQLPLMARAGFTAFEISDAATLAALERQPPPAVAHIYQRDTTAAPAARLLRR